MAKKPPIPEDKLALYDKLVDAHPEIERQGKTMAFTAENGYMFSMMSKAGELGIRLSKEDQTAFFEKYDDKPFMNYGSKMRDYVAIPDDLLADTEALLPYLDASYQYVKSLPHRTEAEKKKKKK